MTTLIPTAILLVSLTAETNVAFGQPANPYARPQWRAEVQSNGAPQSEAMNSLLDALQVASRGEGGWGRILQTAFVVPGSDLAPERIAQISEDLAVMCRILDKAVVWTDRAVGGEMGAAVPVDVSGVEISGRRVATQGLYLDGYGVIFFLPVDFPLTAPPQEQTASKAEPAGDPLWSQTANELRGAPQEPAAPAARQYDAQKVENLKTALIGTLRHASNLRIRRPEDVISIVIASQTKQANANVLYDRIYGSDNTGLLIGSATAPAPEVPSALILRTAKADVDSLAKGGMNLEQFRAKVQVLKAWSCGGAEPVPIGGSRAGTMMPLKR